MGARSANGRSKRCGARGYVPQDTFLFSETLRENIAFGVDSATDEEIHEAADVASIAAEIGEFPAQFNTWSVNAGLRFLAARNSDPPLRAP